MNLLNPFLKPLLTVFLLIIILIGLVNTETFYSVTAFAYYGFCIATLFFTIIPYNNTVNNKSKILKTPIILFGLWCLYVLFHYFSNTGTLVFTIYCICLYFLLLKATILFSTANFNFTQLFIGIATIASIESIYCVGQFLGWFKSQNELFKVTGSWNNPNVIAIFLALSTPAFLFLFRGKNKKTALLGFITLLIALLLLKCRAAFIGAILSIIVFYGLEYNFINWIKDKKNRSSAKALLIISLLIIIPISSQLYNSKKASADGRKFIWKLSAQMATEKPLSGYGYGFFEKEYNLFQADYIKQGKATAEELANAGPVIMPHNELLLNVVEGGIIGLLLLLFFFGSLLLVVKKREKETVTGCDNSIFNLSYAGIVAFIAMSMVNSTIQMVPIMCLLIIYAAIICSMLEPVQLPVKFTFPETNKGISILTKTTIASVNLYVLYLLFGMATADNLNKKAALLKKEKNYGQALQIMPDLAKNINSFSDYWKNYAVIHLEIKQYSKALYCMEKAKKLSSLPDIYKGSGLCYEKLHQYPKAIREYETLNALYPPKFLYKMLLLNAYLKNKDTAKTIALAQEIIQLNPKIPSEKVNEYKYRCRKLLWKLGVRKQLKNNFNLNNNFNSKRFQ
ncbi:O-antigen ligase family protein [Flavobacterium pokkalii]|uniref:O-antigen ligase family protein n=1 Tax=Flavobacterium pokkalii TaxID=1940408 RepID=UPI001661466E|nr:O-antigen ligase family protein [Flavobacterium pokkalii]